MAAGTDSGLFPPTHTHTYTHTPPRPLPVETVLEDG